MAERYTVEKNGRKYVYESTSEYEPGKNGGRGSKKTVTNYIGSIDPETGELKLKKSRSSGEVSLDSEELKCKSLGSSWALKGLAEACGLREDLFKAYGNEGDRMLTAAIAQCVTGGPMASAEDALEGSMTRELLGVSAKMDSPRMTELTQRLGSNAEAEELLFEARIQRARDLLSYDITTVSTSSRMDGWAEWGLNKDGEKMPQLNVGLVTDRAGTPAMYELYPGSTADLATLERTVERVSALGGGSCVMVMDRGFGSASNLEMLLDNGMDFVIPARRATKAVKSMITELSRRRGEQGLTRYHEGKPYTVIETRLAVVPKPKPRAEREEDTNDTVDLELVLPDDPRFAQVAPERTIAACACLNGLRSAEETEKREMALKGIEDRLRAMKPWEAFNSFKKVAGGYAKFLDISISPEGEMLLARRGNAVTYANNREGVFVMLSHGVDSWEDVMRIYDCRTYVEQAFDVYKNELDGDRWRVSSIEAARGRLAVKFCSLILWTEAGRLLREADVKRPVAEVLQSLDNLCAVGRDGKWRRTEITKKNRVALEALGLTEPPKRFETCRTRYIPESLKAEFEDSEARGVPRIEREFRPQKSCLPV